MTKQHEHSVLKHYNELLGACLLKDLELVSFVLFELGAAGVEELERCGDMIKLKSYFVSDQTVTREYLEQQMASYSLSFVFHALRKKPFCNWQSSWREHFKILEIGQSFVIRPPWEKKQPHKHEIIVNPGLGFGTGYHESTRLALCLIEWLKQIHSFDRIFDIGTGSGILMIGALLLGAKEAIAIDVEAEAIEEVPKNVELSGINPQQCCALVGSTDRIEGCADVVIANINDFILIELVSELKRLVGRQGYLLLSGIINEERESVIECFSEHFELVHEILENEWHAFAFRKRNK